VFSDVETYGPPDAVRSYLQSRFEYNSAVAFMSGDFIVESLPGPGPHAAEAKDWNALLKRLREIVAGRPSRTRATAILNGGLEHVSGDLLIRIPASLAYRESLGGPV
jgi:hypothetical protein